MKEKLMKIFRDLMKFGKVETDNGILIFEGDVLLEGTEVYIEDENGNIIPAPDGMYGEYKVVDGKIAPKEEEVAEPEETPVQEVKQEEEVVEPEVPEVDEKEERISALEQAVAELKSIIDAMVAKKEEEEFSSLKPAEKEIKDIAASTNKGAMKYFNK